MNLKNKTKTFLSTALSVIMLFSAAPITTFAAQSSSDYIDPADHWTTTGNRANELDANATVTQETQGCGFCQGKLCKPFTVCRNTRNQAKPH